MNEKKDLDAVVEECKNHGVRAISIAADIKDLEEMKRAVETCVQELGSLSILVNNGYPPPPLSSFSLFPPLLITLLSFLFYLAEY